MRRFVAGLLLCAWLCSCGGDDSGAPADDASARARFSADVNAICDRYSARFREIRELGSVPDVSRWSRQVRGVITEGLDKQRKVVAPPSYADDYRQWLEYGNEQVRVLEELQAAAERDDVEAFDKLFPEADRIDEKADEIARRLGMTSCDGG